MGQYNMIQPYKQSFGQHHYINHKQAKFCLIYVTVLIMDIYQRWYINELVWGTGGKILTGKNLTCHFVHHKSHMDKPGNKRKLPP